MSNVQDPPAVTAATEVRRTISPYDLSSADNPGAVISHPLLKGTNYDEWAIGLRTALTSRKKFGFLDGSIEKPAENSADFEDWKTIQALLVSWIRMTIDPALRSTISHRDNAADLWIYLKKRFSVLSGSRLQQLKSELACCKQRGMAIESYFGKLNRIWDSLNMQRPIRVCTCGRCECDLHARQEVDREEDKVHQFLYGLDDQFRSIRSSIVSRTPLQSLEEVYNMVRHEEDFGNMNVEAVPEIAAFATQTKQRYKSDVKEKTIMCSHCNRTTHASDRCFSVIGYPEWWGDRPKVRNLAGRGHGKGRGRGQNHNANCVYVPNVEKNVTAANYVVTDNDREEVKLTDDQWSTLKSLLNSGKNTSNSTEHLSGTTSNLPWILDTGASHHLTGRYEILSNVREMPPVLVIMADGREKISVKAGTIQLGLDLILKSVYYVEALKSELISVTQLMDENSCVIQVANQYLVIQDRSSRMVIRAGKRVGGTFHFRSLESVAAASTRAVAEFELWHTRLGHPATKVVSLIPNVAVSVFENKACEVCLRAKQTRDCFPLSNNTSSTIFELIHVDVWGPYRTQSHSGAKFFLTVVDDYSRCIWVYLLNDKSQVSKYLKEFVAMTERQFTAKVLTIRSDNGTEFLTLTPYFAQLGIRHETSCVGTPQQNGRVERKHRHVLNVARALLFQANLPIQFWGECILTACYLINRTPSYVLQNKTPYERLYKKAPTYSALRVFGCLAYAHNQHKNGDKFASRSHRCIFVGYPHGKKGWRMYDLEKQEFFVSRDVVFCETKFPYIKSTEESSEEEGYLWAPIATNLQHEDLIVGPRTRIRNQYNIGLRNDENGPNISTPSSSSSIGDTPVVTSTMSSITPRQNTTPLPAAPPEELGKGQRRKMPSVLLKNYVVPPVKHNTNLAEVKQETGKIAYSIVEESGRFSEKHIAYVTTIIETKEPKSFREAMQDKRWRISMGQEVKALEDNKTWDIVDLPHGKRAIGSQWVFKVKFTSDGTVERFKSRLVALGNKQIAGEDYRETYAPVAKMDTVRIFLDVACKNKWDIHQMDVHNAFLHGDLNEDVYMKLPPGFQTGDRNRVCKLKKSLYGLRQAPRCWFSKLSSALITYGFKQSKSDYSLFTLGKGEVRLHILVYVDDLIITGSCQTAMDKFKVYLSSCFHMKDLGPLKYFLGIEVARNNTGMYLCQRKYATDIIKDMGMLASKPAAFPLEQNHKLALSTSQMLLDPTPYRRLLGRLIYLLVTRPDLAYAVHILSQFMSKPKEAHWQAALRVVRYLKADPGQGIMLRAEGSFQVIGWCDSDWASCPLTRRSLSGYIVQIGDSPVAWKTKKHNTVSRSSSEAEYRSIAYLTTELLWLRRLLFTLGVQHTQPMHLYCDNKSAIYIATNPVFHERTKHVELDLHFVRDEVKAETIQLKHVSTTTQLADIFTKPLGQDNFKEFRSKLGIHNLYSPA